MKVFFNSFAITLSLLTVSSPVSWAGGNHHGHHPHMTPETSPPDDTPNDTGDTAKISQVKKYICKDSPAFEGIFGQWSRYLDFQSRGKSSWDENLRILANGISNHLGAYKYPVIHTYGSVMPQESIQVQELTKPTRVEVTFLLNLGDHETVQLTAVLIPGADAPWSLNADSRLYLGTASENSLLCAKDVAKDVKVTLEKRKATIQPHEVGGPIHFEELKPIEVTKEMMEETRKPIAVPAGHIDDNTKPIKPVPIKALERPVDRH